MKIQTQNYNLPVVKTRVSPESGQGPELPSPQDQVNFSDSRPAHRVVKKISRGAAGLVGAATLAKVGYDLASSPTLQTGLLKAALSLAGGGALIVGMDLASGLWHHRGDNYGSHAQTLKHTKWHTNTQDTDYCLIGVSNKALDKLGFWPRWEKLIYEKTGAEPVAWKVEPYRNFALGKIDESQLKAELSRLGMPLS